MADITATTAANQLADYLNTYIERRILEEFRREPTLPMFAVRDFSGQVAANEFKVRVPDMSATKVALVNWPTVQANAAVTVDGASTYGLPATLGDARGVSLGYIDLDIDLSRRVDPLHLDTRFLDYNPIMGIVDDWAMKVGWAFRDGMNADALTELAGIIDDDALGTGDGNRFGDNITIAAAANWDSPENRKAIVQRIGRAGSYMRRWQWPGMHYALCTDTTTEQIEEWLRFPGGTDNRDAYGSGITQDRMLTGGLGPLMYNLWGVYVVPVKGMADGDIDTGTGGLTGVNPVYFGCTGAPPLFYAQKPPLTKVYEIPGSEGIGMGYWRGQYWGYQSSAKRHALHFAFNRTG